jgi:GH15 family glucan-1,4-alpha-glucosidase
MAWVAFDRAVKAVERFGLEGPVDRWRAVAAAIHRSVCAQGVDPAGGHFVQAYGSRALDASLLLLPLVGFVRADDPRMLRTVAAIERGLAVDGLVLRYRTDETDDGLAGGEGVFLPCSFWLADNYALVGRHVEARALFERLLGLANDVGLLAEEYDPHARRQLGNFPQALTHVALVNTARNLSPLAGGPSRDRGEAVAEGEPR